MRHTYDIIRTIDTDLLYQTIAGALLRHIAQMSHGGASVPRMLASIRHAKAAPFKRNDAMLDILPIAVITFAGTGIRDNLADQAHKLGIPLFDSRPT